MTDDFYLVDFALLRAPLPEVATALGTIAAASGAPAPSGPGTDGSAAAHSWLGRVSRLWPAQKGPPPGTRPLLIQDKGHLPPAPLARFMPDDLGFGAGETPFRVTAPIGEAGLTLLEFREGDSGRSSIAAALSAQFPGTDVFYFRLSGLHHPGAETAFQIYQNGNATRRSASHSAEGINPEADWRVTDSGIPHTLEADSLPPTRARAWEVMTPERQGRILSAMGIQPDALFAPDPDARVIELSTAQGGRGLDQIAQVLSDRARSAAKTDAPGPPSAAAVSPQAAAGHVPASSPAPRSGSGAGSGEMDADWDAEVTGILVTAVAHALPEAEHIPWLTHLTAQLEAGNVDAALAEAKALIEMGDRPPEERQRDAERLMVLFGAEFGP
ncbi:MAG: hypothetical protein AAGB05_10290 [Pseudomonadota bacterium]